MLQEGNNQGPDVRNDWAGIALEIETKKALTYEAD